MSPHWSTGDYPVFDTIRETLGGWGLAVHRTMNRGDQEVAFLTWCILGNNARTTWV